MAMMRTTSGVRGRHSSDELRKQVWDTLVQFKGDREAAAEALDVSPRTLNRYIHDLNLYEDMDKAGLMRNAGPPRGDRKGTSKRQEDIVAYIHAGHGELDYGELAVKMYGKDNDTTRQRVYTALNELKEKGVIALDGSRWFIL